MSNQNQTASTGFGIPSSVYLAVALALFAVFSGLGAFSLSNPTTALEGGILAVVIGALFLASQYNPATLRTTKGTTLISGSVIFAAGIYLLGQAASFMNTNIVFAGVLFLAGGVLIIVGTLFPSGVLQEAVAKANTIAR
jgi:hypothetical protein